MSCLQDHNDQVVGVNISKPVGDVDIQVVLHDKDSTLGNEGFRISKSAEGLAVEAVGESGEMYGLLELADLIELHGSSQVPETIVHPRFPFRAIKYNLPWSIYGRHPSNEQHAEVVRDLEWFNGDEQKRQEAVAWLEKEKTGRCNPVALSGPSQ